VTLKEALQQQGINVENLSERQILVNINDVPKILLQRSFMLRLNHEIADLQVALKENDVIEFSFDTPTFYRIRDIMDAPLGFDKMRINVDGDDIEIDVESAHVLMNGNRVTLNEFLIDGADIKISYFKGRHVLLSDIFKYIEFDPLKGLGKNLKILVNGQPAGFTTPLHEGSRVRFLFEERPQNR
jgi:molybdopterin converting factor small subunit